MDLLRKVDELWNTDKEGIEERIRGWVRDLDAKRAEIVAARRQFRQWTPLRVYTCTSQAKKNRRPTFSLRYCGQEVATLILKTDGKLYVSIRNPTQSNNARDFDVPVATSYEFAWDSSRGRAFREHFKKHRLWQEPPKRVREHHLESMVIREMHRKTSTKFGTILTQIQPVLLYGMLPFQVPIPFSASAGVPEPAKRGGGNIDILARRRGHDNRVRLSVWELKRPGNIDHAVVQSCIYAAVLRYMLRSSAGSEWYRLFGFLRALPASLEIEAVVLLSESKRKECAAQVEALRNGRGSRLDGDRIILSVAFYDDKTLRLTQFEEGKAVLL
jgi:hypothetical protein